MGTITVTRDRGGAAWAQASCGCRIRMLAPPDELYAFVEHVLEKTPCDRGQPSQSKT